MAGAVGAGAGGAVGCVIAGAVLVGAGGGGAGVLGGGGVFGVGVGGGGASVINTASTVFSVMRTTLRAKPVEIAQSNSACRASTHAIPARCLRGERCRAAYGDAGDCEE